MNFVFLFISTIIVYAPLGHAQTPTPLTTIEKLKSGLNQADTQPDIKVLQPGDKIWSCSTYVVRNGEAILADGSVPSFNFTEVKDDKGITTGFKSTHDEKTQVFNALFTFVTKGTRRLLVEDVSKQGMMIYLAKVNTKLGVPFLILEINSVESRTPSDSNTASILAPGETTLGYQFCI